MNDTLFEFPIKLLWQLTAMATYNMNFVFWKYKQWKLENHVTLTVVFVNLSFAKYLCYRNHLQGKYQFIKSRWYIWIKKKQFCHNTYNKEKKQVCALNSLKKLTVQNFKGVYMIHPAYIQKLRVAQALNLWSVHVGSSSSSRRYSNLAKFITGARPDYSILLLKVTFQIQHQYVCFITSFQSRNAV